TSCSSAGGRCGPMRPTRAGSRRPTGRRSAKWPWGTARTSATRSKRPTRPPPGRARAATPARRCSTISPRPSRSARTSSRRGSRPSRAGTRPPPGARSRRALPGCSATPRGPTSTTARCTMCRCRGVTLAMHEPIGVVGVACPEAPPLLGFVSLVAPAVAVGNTVVAVPSEREPLAAAELSTVLEASDVPAGVINIVTGAKDELALVLAEHDDVDAVWYFGTREGAAAVEQASAGNLKRTWVEWEARDWFDEREGEGREFLRAATQVKNIWIPYGE